MDERVMRLLDRGISDSFVSESLPVSLVEQHILAHRLQAFANKLPDVAQEVGPDLVVLAIDAILARLKDLMGLPTRPVDALWQVGETFLRLHREYAAEADTQREDLVFWLVLNAVEEEPSPLLPDPLAYKPVLGASGHQRFLRELEAAYSTADTRQHEELLGEPTPQVQFMQMRLADPMTAEQSARQAVERSQRPHQPLVAYTIITLLQFGMPELAQDLHRKAAAAVQVADSGLADRAWDSLTQHADSAVTDGSTPAAFHRLFQKTLLFEQWPSAVVAHQLRQRSGALWQMYFRPHIMRVLEAHPGELMRYFLMEKNYQRAWDWAREHDWDPTGGDAAVWLELLAQLAPRHRQEVLATIERKVQALIDLQLARSYELACRYLQLYRELSTGQDSDQDFQNWVGQLRHQYARRTRFIAALDLAGL